MNDIVSSSGATAPAHGGAPSPDDLAKRFFILAILGVAACVSVIIGLLSLTSG
ncbi:MAG TPA: hypothetical protein VK509_19550 [Polyangiales bacterium]|nr:hypothetical protein [Polyangiales bacterium]